MAGTTTKEAPAKEPTTHKYVVLSDAIVVTIGKKANGRAEYTRVLRGRVLNGNPNSEQIKTLLKAGAIERVTSKEQLAEMQADLAKGAGADPRTGRVFSRYRQTARKSSKAMGAPDDPVAPVIEDTVPVKAPLPETSPGAILTGDAEE